MTKKVKLELTLNIKEDTIIDEFMVKRMLEQLGEVVSYNLSDFKEGNDNSQSEVQNQQVEITQISEFINEANKIYFGSLSIDNRKDVALAILHISNLDKLGTDQLKQKFSETFTKKFGIDSTKIEKLMNDTNNSSLLDLIRTKFLEGDLAQMIIYIWEVILSQGEEEDDFEIGLVENLAEKFSIESQNFNEIKKNGLERAKISRGIQSVLSGRNAYNKLKAFEKGVLLALMLTECSTIGGKIASEELLKLKKILGEQLNISANQATVILEKKLSESLLKKVEQFYCFSKLYNIQFCK